MFTALRQKPEKADTHTNEALIRVYAQEVAAPLVAFVGLGLGRLAPAVAKIAVSIPAFATTTT